MTRHRAATALAPSKGSVAAMNHSFWRARLRLRSSSTSITHFSFRRQI